MVVVANRGDGDDGFVGERLAELGAQFVRVWPERRFQRKSAFQPLPAPGILVYYWKAATLLIAASSPFLFAQATSALL